METLNLKIEGMGGSHCVMVIKHTLSTLPGTEIKNIEVGKVEVNYEQQKINRGQIIQAIENAGYRTTSV